MSGPRRGAAVLAAWLLGAVLQVQAAAEPVSVRFPAAPVVAAIEAVKGNPLAFAAPLRLPLQLADGQWDMPKPGVARWRLALSSPGALSLSLRLENLRLPPDAVLSWHAEPAGDRHGPLQPDAQGQLWLPLVRSDQAVLEVRLPASQRPGLQLAIAEGFHGFRGPGSVQAKRSSGASGPCNINTACSEGDDWRSDIRSVVLITIDNSTLCTGTLLNNSRQDLRPLVLTARHCEIRSDAISGVRAYFNLERGCCANAPEPVTTQFIDARAVLLEDEATDLALLELSAIPPPAYHAYYAGWDARPQHIPQSGAAIHHPSGDDKRISLFNRPVRAVDGQPIGTAPQGFNVDAWEVRWSSGTTEQGSSGGALWNQDRRVVGQLSGGDASCRNLDGRDYFGRLERAWINEPALRQHLAPDSEALFLDGLEAHQPPRPLCKTGQQPQPSPAPASGGGGYWSGSLLLTLLALLRLARRRWA